MKKDSKIAMAIEKKKNSIKLDKQKLLKSKKEKIEDSENEILK